MFASLRRLTTRHVSVVPLLVCAGGVSVMAVLYLARVGLRNPDVVWDHKNNPEPWNKVGPNYQYKFYSVNTDYSKLKKDGPDF